MGHLIGDKVRKAYDKSLMLEERREFLEQWCELLVKNGLKIWKHKKQQGNQVPAAFMTIVCTMTKTHQLQTNKKLVVKQLVALNTNRALKPEN